MIELRTGVPGSGKSLSMVHALAKLIARWEKHPDEARPIFVHGIPDLVLPHAVLPLKKHEQSRGVWVVVPDWDLMPDGSLVLVDECQSLFPPRSSQSVPPPHIAWFNTHRHKGFDLWLTTQHPKLIDGAIRALVGKHMHCRRLFGGKRAVVYEWDACSDGLSGYGNAVKSYFEFPREAFKYYKSAEIHTKQSFKKPMWVFVPLLAVAGMIYSFPKVYDLFKHGMHKPAEQVDLGAIPPPVAPPAAAATVPSVGGTVTPQGGAMVPAAFLQPVFKPRVAACLASASKCKCYTPGGALYVVTELECRNMAENTTARFGVDTPENNAMPSPSLLPVKAVPAAVAASVASNP